MLGSIVGGLAGGIGSILGGAANQAIGSHFWKANQKWLLSNSNQLKTEDLRKAGLNPVLAVQSGGATPVVAPHSSSFDGSGLVKAATGVYQASSAKRLNEAQIDLFEAQQRQVNSATVKNNADAAKSLAEASLVKQESDYIRGKGVTAGVSPFDNKYYGNGILGMGSTARDLSRLGGEFFRALRNLLSPAPADAGAHGGRNSSKSIQFDKEEEDKYRKKAEEILKSPYRKNFSGFL